MYKIHVTYKTTDSGECYAEGTCLESDEGSNKRVFDAYSSFETDCYMSWNLVEQAVQAMIEMAKKEITRRRAVEVMLPADQVIEL